MKVILLQDVKKIGKAKDIVNVSDGYARNFLFPKKLAKPADNSSVKQVEMNKEKQAQNKAHQIEEANKNKKELEGLEINIKAKAGENGKLFKAISEDDIKNQIKVPYKSIDFTEPIKQIGEHEVTIKILEDIEAKVKIKVESE